MLTPASAATSRVLSPSKPASAMRRYAATTSSSRRGSASAGPLGRPRLTVGLALGEDAAWARNVLAAGECGLRYRGVDYHLVEPVKLDSSAVGSELPPVMRFGLSVLGVPKVLRMRRSTTVQAGA